MSAAIHAFRWMEIPGQPEDHVIDDVEIVGRPLCGLRDRRTVYWTPAQGDRRQCARCREKLIVQAEGVTR